MTRKEFDKLGREEQEEILEEITQRIVGIIKEYGLTPVIATLALNGIAKAIRRTADERPFDGDITLDFDRDFNAEYSYEGEYFRQFR